MYDATHALNIPRHKGKTKQAQKQVSLNILTAKRSQIKMANRNLLEGNLERLEQELASYKRNLASAGLAEEERMRLLVAVRDVEREILSTLRDLRDLTELENSRMMRAILAIEKNKKK